MIKDKYRTFLRTLKYSYQSCDVQKLDQIETHRALINPSKNNTEYDEKILSIDYAYNFQPGDIFKWVGTNTYWLVYLQELTEDAYFRSKIRRCRFQIYWIDNKEKISSYAYIKGPIETKINDISKSNASIDVPNWSLQILLPKNEKTLKHFKRYQTFAFNNIVWEIQAVDDISIEGVIEIVALEHYINQSLDDVNNEKVTDAFYIYPVIPKNNNQDNILGESLIKPNGQYQYRINDNIEKGGQWSILEKNYPVTIFYNEENNEEISLCWNLMKSGQFTLVYEVNDKKYERVIIVESLF